MKKTKAEKINRAVELHLRDAAQGKERFDVSTKHLMRAVKLGLRPGDIVLIGAQRYELIDNRELLNKKGAIYRPARLPVFEVKPVTQSKSKELDAAEKAHLEAAAVPAT